MKAIAQNPRRIVTVVAALTTLAVAGWLLGQQAWASYHWRAAQSEAARYHYQQAKDHIIVCHRIWPDDRTTLLLAARIARRLGSFEEADGLLTRCQELYGEEDELLIERLLLRCERGDVDAVSPMCRMLVDQGHAKSGLILEALIAGYFRNLRFRDADFCVHLWQSIEPDSAQAEYLKGFVLEMQVKQLEAIQAFRRVLTLDAEHDEARYRLAANLLDFSQANEALPHLVHLQTRQPTHVATLVELGRCYDLLGRQAEAEAHLDRALALQPNNGSALHERGLLAMRREQWQQAENWLHQAAELMPGDFQLHYQLSQCWHRLGKTDEARALQSKLKQLEDDSKRMREIATHEMSRSPNDPNLHYELGMISMRAGNVTEGLRWFKSALQADPAHELTHEAFARFYRANGQIGRAAKHLEFVKSKDHPSEEAQKIGGPFP